MSDLPESQVDLEHFDIDIVVKVLSKTLFSPFFCIFLPITLLSQVKSTSHPAFIWSSAWTALVCFLSFLKHVDRIYSSQASWLFAPPKLKWEDQIVLITGGGTGVGALLAETLATRNVTVVVLTKDAPKYETQSESIHTYLCDVSDYDSVMSVAAKVQDEVGHPTIIVNNAGVVKGKLLLDLTREDVQDTFGANTLAQFWILKAFLPEMIKRGSGHVVTMSSVLGLVNTAQMTDYCASKAALVSLHQSLRAELDSRYLAPAIRTTLVLPSFIMTSMFSAIKFPRSRLFRFLAPAVQPHVIVKEIIDALDAHESRVIRLPSYTQLARLMGPGVGLVPKWLSDAASHLAGANHAMREYGPHPDASERIIAERQAEKKES